MGFVVDLGESREVTAVDPRRRLSPGVRYEVRAIQGDASEDADGLGAGGSARRTPPRAPCGPSSPSRSATRYLLVYVTGDLQPIEGRFSAAFAELAVEALP